MSLQKAFREAKKGKYEYYYIEKAIRTLPKQEMLNIIEQNLLYLISYQESEIVRFQHLSYRLLIYAIKEWVCEKITNESYGRFRECQAFLEKWLKSEKFSISVTSEIICPLIEKIKKLFKEYEVRTKTDEVKKIILQ